MVCEWIGWRLVKNCCLMTCGCLICHCPSSPNCRAYQTMSKPYWSHHRKLSVRQDSFHFLLNERLKRYLPYHLWHGGDLMHSGRMVAKLLFMSSKVFALSLDDRRKWKWIGLRHQAGRIDLILKRRHCRWWTSSAYDSSPSILGVSSSSDWYAWVCHR